MRRLKIPQGAAVSGFWSHLLQVGRFQSRVVTSTAADLTEGQFAEVGPPAGPEPVNANCIGGLNHVCSVQLAKLLWSGTPLSKSFASCGLQVVLLNQNLRTCFEIASIKKNSYGSIPLTPLIGRSRSHEMQNRISQRFDGPAMASNKAIAAEALPARAETYLPTLDHRCDSLCDTNRMPMADVACRFPELEYCVRRFS